MSETTATRKTVATIAALALGWLAAAWFLWDTQVPTDLDPPDVNVREFFTARQIDKAEDYERFVWIVILLSLVATLVALAVLARRAPKLARATGLGPIGAGMIVGMIMLVVLWAVDLPFAVALRWWDERHDLAEGSWAEWLVEPWAALGGSVVFVMLQIAIVMGFARRYRRFWWIPVTPIFLALTGVFLLVSPYLLAFGVNRPEDPQLRRDIRVLADRVGAEGTPVDIEEVSDLTSQANAFAAGLGPTTRVVLYDTLLDGRFSDEAVKVVVAHEFGHVARDHLWKGFAWFALLAFPIAFVVAEATRRRGGMGDPGVLPYGILLLLIVQVVLLPPTNVLYRRYEAEADWVALRATDDPEAAQELFEGFSNTSLSDPDPPAWVHVLFDTHPTLLERIEMAEAYERRHGSARAP
jgi:STE24 endopeptidase